MGPLAPGTSGDLRMSSWAFGCYTQRWGGWSELVRRVELVAGGEIGKCSVKPALGSSPALMTRHIPPSVRGVTWSVSHTPGATTASRGTGASSRTRNTAVALFAAFAVVALIPTIALAAEADWPWGLSAGVLACVAGVLLVGAGAPRRVTLPLIALSVALSVVTATGDTVPAPGLLLGIFAFLLIIETGPRSPLLFAVVAVVYVAGSVLLGPSGIGLRALDDAVLALAVVGAGSIFFGILTDAGARLDAARDERLATEHDADLQSSQLTVTARSRGLLHDDVIGTLNRIADFGELGSPALLLSCARLRETLRRGGGNPGSAEQPGAPIDLATLVEDVRVVTDLRVLVNPGPVFIPSPTQAYAVRRALGEALRNAERHAHVQLVQVSWDLTPRTVRLSVVDHGVGASDPKSRWGLNGSLRQPMHDLGGDAAITPTPGGGTTVKLSWPLETGTPNSSLQQAHSETLRAVAGRHHLATRIAAYALAGNGWLALRHSWGDPLAALELLLAATVIIGSLLAVRRVQRHPPTAALLVQISIATATATTLGLLLAGPGSLRTYNSWAIGLASVVTTLVAFFVPLRWLSLLVGPALAAVIVFVLSQGYGFGEAGGALLAATLPPALAMMLGASLRASLVSLDREEARGRKAAAAAHDRRLRQTVGQRMLEPARAALVPWLNDLVEGRRSLGSPDIRAEARALATDLRDDLHVHGALDDVLRLRLSRARRGGTSVKLAALHESVEPEGAGPCLRLLDRALDLGATARILDVRVPEVPRPEGELTVIPALDNDQVDRLVHAVAGCDVAVDQRGFATTIRFIPPAFTRGEVNLRLP